MLKACKGVHSFKKVFYKPTSPHLTYVLRAATFQNLFLLENQWQQRRIQNLLKHLRWTVLQAVNYFRKTFHLRCLGGFWIRLWADFIPSHTWIFFKVIKNRKFVLSQKLTESIGMTLYYWNGAILLQVEANDVEIFVLYTKMLNFKPKFLILFVL